MEPGEELLALDGVLKPVKSLPAFECPEGVKGVDRAPEPGAVGAARDGVQSVKLKMAPRLSGKLLVMFC